MSIIASLSNYDSLYPNLDFLSLSFVTCCKKLYNKRGSVFNLRYFGYFLLFTFIIYKFGFSINEMTWAFLISRIFTFAISFCLTMFFLDKFKFSNNIIIYYIQKFIFYFIIPLCLVIICLFVFGSVIELSSGEDNSE